MSPVAALIVANTAHVFSVPHNLELMRKMRAGVQPGARRYWSICGPIRVTPSRVRQL